MIVLYLKCSQRNLFHNMHNVLLMLLLSAQPVLHAKNNSVRHFEKDPYGCHSKELQKKRIERNPFKRKAPYELSCPEIAGLLKWCGPELYPKEKLPWKDLE